MSGRSFGGRGSRRFGWLYAALAIVVALAASLVALGPASQTSGSAEAAERAMPRSVVGDDTLGYWTPMGISNDSVHPWLDPGLNNAVYALASYGGSIYAGGYFDDTGNGSAANNASTCTDDTLGALYCIARWDPATNAWTAVGPGLNNTVDSLAVMDGKLYAGGLFDDTFGGVGDVNKVCTGDDTPSGDLWTAEIAASDDSWSSVAWGDPEVAPSTSVSTLVAVASGGDDTRVMTSPDGVNWSSPSGPIPVNDWQSVVWGGRFVAVGSLGDDSQVMTSPNGINWTPRLAASDDSWSSVTFRNDNGTFVAVAASGDDTRVMYSNDGAGVTWSSPSSPVPVNAWQSVAWGDDTFVAVASSGDDTRVMYSNDDSGAIWLSPSSPVPVNAWQSVAWGDGTFVAVGSRGDDSQVMTSPNGVTWTPRLAASDDSWSSVTYGNGTFVAVASSGDDSRIMTSRDNGVTWTLRNSPAANAWQSVAWGHASLWPDTFVAVGSNPPRTSQVMRSALMWSPDPLGCIAVWDEVSWSPVSSGLNGKAQVMTVLGDDTLIVAGGFDRAGTLGRPNSARLPGLAAWSDGTWTAPGVGGFQESVSALVADGPSVAYIGGQYEGDGADDSGIMQMTGPFNGSSSWFPMSTGFSYLAGAAVRPGRVDAFALLDEAIYAGGYFSATGDRSRPLPNLASWEGASWQTVGPGLNSRGITSVRALAADDTRGLLYVGGTFDDTPGGYGNGQCDDTTIPGGPLRCVTVWDTGINQFIPFQWGSADDSNGLTGEVQAFVVDDSVVYVGGNFNTNGQGAFPYQWNLKNVGKWTWGAPSAAVTSSTGTAGSSVPITGSRLIGVSEVRFGSTPATFTRSSITQMSATVPNLAPGTYPVTVNAVGGIATAGTYTVTANPTPDPPTAPRDVTATAGDASATITWQAPASAGSYPVTDYEVTSSPGSRTCLVSATTCRITGLTNGTSYTFTARALTGAGWSVASAPSNAVTPRAEPPASAIVITGTRSAAKATVTGKTTGFGMGGMVTAHTRTARGTAYTTGSTALVSTTGTFEWSRGISKRKTLWVYFTGGDAKSNVLLLRP